MNPPLPRRDWLALWIYWSAWCAVSGWLLSALGQLDRAGYAMAILLFLVGLALKRRFWEIPSARPLFLVRRTTYARLLPKLWLALALMALAGGVLYHPDNYDYLSYRFPRLLHWSWEHHWYWIDTPNNRQNLSAVGMEWLMAPLFVLFRTDRLFFLINFVSFLFLPGLVFSLFRHLGIAGRIAWWWMWLLPMGFCFILQAASMGNDGFATIYFLAALHYAFRAEKGSPQALVLSLLSIALLTGTKASNMPLALPWLAILWLRRGPVLASVRPILLAGTCVVGAVCSFLPIALANIHYTGGYTGDPSDTHHLEIHQPLMGVAGNAVEIVADNLAPPIWPHPIRWPLQERLKAGLVAGYPRFELTSTPFQLEENAGVGLGITLFVLVCFTYGVRNSRAARRSGFELQTVLWVAATLIAWLAYMSKMGSEAAPRLVASYYIPGIAALLLLFPVDGRTIHRHGWRGVSCLALAMAFLLLVFNPSRPLLPPRLITAGLQACHVPAAEVNQLGKNYELRESRRDGLAYLRREIPATEKVIGFMSGRDDPGVSLWLPFGSREVVNVTPSATDLASRHIHYVVISGAILENVYHLTLPDLLAKWSMKVVRTEEVVFKTRRERETWYLLHSSLINSGPRAAFRSQVVTNRAKLVPPA